MESSDAGALYREVRRRLSRLVPASGSLERSIEWVVGERLGVARDPLGRVELFISGPHLVIEEPVVRDHAHHDRWNRSEGPSFHATRVVLPGEVHFDAVAAFVCAHLLESGVASDAQVAMTRTEPVIALAFERARARSEAVLGLCGELLVLRALVRESPRHTEEIVDGWFGHIRSGRDIQLGDVGVEVKTTTRGTSQHPVSGIHQVEPGHGVGGVPERFLILASVGVEPAPEGRATSDSWTLPSLVSSLEELLRQLPGGPRVVERFLTHVRDYGDRTGRPYDHHMMQEDAEFGTRWRTTFARFYDMGSMASLRARVQ